MFKLPVDIETDLIKKYPNVDISNFVHDMITFIIQKACFDGSCSIRDFGKFLSYKIYSSRLGKETVRFKFKHSTSFLNRIKNDKYMLEKLAVRIAVPFTEQHEKKCADKQDRKRPIEIILPQIHKKTRENTNYKTATQKILEILDTDPDNLGD